MKWQFAAFLAVYAAAFAYVLRRYADRLAFHKYLSNHVLLFAPLNFMFTFFARGPQAATYPAQSVPGLDRLKAAYPIIREEARALRDAGAFQRAPAKDEAGYNTFERGGWRLYRLKWYSPECDPAAKQACPRTCAIVDSIPSVRSALFTVLPPGARLGRHHDPVASSLRYHLGLLTPNSERCALTLDGVAHPWRDGEELLFDPTYLHSAVNETDVVRVILFCDVEKTQLWRPIKPLADAVDFGIVSKFTGADAAGKLSWLSAAYKPIYAVRTFVKQRIKRRSRAAYNAIKFGTIAAALALIYWAF
ncbi:MAG: aspartyl/asparaginyl beta-hydroxylase domain-containing protein [Tagaea sp.]